MSILDRIHSDNDDTAEVLVARARIGDAATEEARHRGLEWLLGMQSKDGGWGAFDADNRRAIWNSLPVADYGAMIDPPTADVTAHVYGTAAARLALRSYGVPADSAVQRGEEWLRRVQRPDGGWGEDPRSDTGTGFPGDFYFHYELYPTIFATMALGQFRARLLPAEKR